MNAATTNIQPAINFVDSDQFDGIVSSIERQDDGNDDKNAIPPGILPFIGGLAGGLAGGFGLAHLIPRPSFRPLRSTVTKVPFIYSFIHFN